MTTSPCSAAGDGCRFTGPGYYRIWIPSRGEPQIHVAYVAVVECEEGWQRPETWLAVWLTAPIAAEPGRPVWEGTHDAVESGLVERIET